MPECQSTHRKTIGDSELEVIAFYPGVSCLEAKCGQAEAVCMIGDRKYETGERAVLGCQECTCESSGQFICRLVNRTGFCFKLLFMKCISDIFQTASNSIKLFFHYIVF